MVLVREFTDQLNDFWVILCIDNPFTFLLCLCFTQVVVIRRALDLYMPSSMSSTHTPIYDIRRSRAGHIKCSIGLDVE
jgi:hypothetical protein